jgi:hypothetical protein
MSERNSKRTDGSVTVSDHANGVQAAPLPRKPHGRHAVPSRKLACMGWAPRCVAQKFMTGCQHALGNTTFANPCFFILTYAITNLRSKQSRFLSPSSVVGKCLMYVCLRVVGGLLSLLTCIMSGE